MSNQKNREKSSWSEGLEKKLVPQEPFDEPIPLSLIIPVYNCADAIGETLESVARQEYEPLEVIIIDAGSTDRTLEIINSYASLISRIYTVPRFQMADMVNRGIPLASHSYLSFLFPGSYYLSDLTYRTFAQAVHQEKTPDVLYCGSIQRELKRSPRLVQYPFQLKYIQRGQHPATIPACWFRQEIFEKVGRLNPHLTLRPGFEFFCRIVCEEEVRVHQIDRVFVDFDYGRFSYGKILRFAGETWEVLSTHFGFRVALKWFVTLDHFILIKWLWKSFKETLFQR
ncbi:MAG: hypothetical protein S4CHLAM2_11130 [Chlamydiales bacterium]|nr:hypothetical protein [Chlamydiales bacterium]